MKNRKAIQFSGIANISSFSSLLKELEVNVVEVVEFVDHHPFTKQELLHLKDLAMKHQAILITTEKDMFRSHNLMNEVFSSIESYALTIQLQVQDIPLMERCLELV